MKKNEPVKISINQEHWPKETLSINAAEREVRLTVFFFLGGWLVLILIILNSVNTNIPFVLVFVAAFVLFCLYGTIVTIRKSVEQLSEARELDQDGINIKGICIGKWVEPDAEGDPIGFAGFKFSYLNKDFLGKRSDRENIVVIGQYAQIRFLPRAPNIFKFMPDSSGQTHRAFVSNLDNEEVQQAMISNGPIGHWRAVPSTFLTLMDSAVHFNSDGSGSLRSNSVMNGEMTLNFRWRIASYGVLQCLSMFDADNVDSRKQSAEDSQDEGDWQNVPMLIEPFTTDTGTYWVLRENGRQGFWHSVSPLIPEELSDKNQQQ